MEPSGPVLEMRGICKRFGGVQALDNVDFSANSGEVIALIGENGAGKSTLMNVLGGILVPDSGSISVYGRERAIRNVPHAIELRIGFIHQEPNVLDNLDVASNIFLGREPHGRAPLKLIDRARLYERARPYLDQLGLAIAGDHPLRELSLAQRQMVEIAKALSQRARILIMDEPTSSLTSTETLCLFRIIQRLRTEGVAIIFVSHKLGEIVEIADRVAALRDGRNSGWLTKSEITPDRMVQLMVGRSLQPEGDGARTDAASSSSEGLQVRNLATKAFPGRRISFTCGCGEILGFAGLVGAGRSEMAQALFGIAGALDGEVLLSGKRAFIRCPSDAIDAGVLLIPEDRRDKGLIMQMSIRENISLPCLSRYSVAGWIDRRREREASVAQRKALNLTAPSVETPVDQLSGGNQQKVVLGKWLQFSPTVVIFDEPTRGIDVGAKAEIYKLIRELAGAGASILLISSELEELILLSDRIVVMRAGVVTGILQRHEFGEEAIMRLAVDETVGEPLVGG
jgi:ribose transport system ATP-binding protein